MQAVQAKDAYNVNSKSPRLLYRLKKILCNIFTQISQVYKICSWNSCIWIALNINVMKLNVCQDRKWLAYCENFYFSFSRYPVASDKERISRNISCLTSWEIIEFKILAWLLDLLLIQGKWDLLGGFTWKPLGRYLEWLRRLSHRTAEDRELDLWDSPCS